MSKPRAAWSVVLALAAAAAGYWVSSRWFAHREAVAVSEPVRDIASFRFVDLAGRGRAVSDWSAPYLIVNFWATWCAPCLREIPNFVKLQACYGPSAIQFIGVAVDEPEAVQAFARRHAVNYPMLIGQPSALALGAALGNSIGALPYTAILDAQRRVVFKQHGEWPVEAAEARLQDLRKSIN